MVTCNQLDLSDLFPEKTDAFAVVIDGLFTPQECADLIAMTEKAGYQEALVGLNQTRDSQQRNNWRCIIDDATLADTIYQKVAPYVPKMWLGYTPVGLNERLRFLKYHPGEYFKPHCDGIYVRDDQTQTSFITIHLYLNTVAEGHGGETTFTTEPRTYGKHAHNNKQPHPWSFRRESVRPVTGRVLVFEHHLPHEGSLLTQGTKYTMHTDVMYNLHGDKPVRLPRWRSKFPHPQYRL